MRAARRVSKLLVSLAYYGIRRTVLLPALLVPRLYRPEVVVLTYHQLRPSQAMAFERQLCAIRRAGRSSFPDLTPPPAGARRFIAVTFDDGFEQAFRTAEPILRRRRIESTWFVTTGYLGEAAGWIRQASNGNVGARLVSPGQLAKADPSLVKIGTHTITHRRLPALPPSEVNREVGRPRHELEDALGRTVELLAFPYGDYSPHTLLRCRAAGYRRVFGNLPVWGFASRGGFLRGRIPVEPSDWSLEFWLKLRGGYNWLALNGFVWHELMPRVARTRGRGRVPEKSA